MSKCVCCQKCEAKYDDGLCFDCEYPPGSALREMYYLYLEFQKLKNELRSCIPRWILKLFRID